MTLRKVTIHLYQNEVEALLGDYNEDEIDINLELTYKVFELVKDHIERRKNDENN